MDLDLMSYFTSWRLKHRQLFFSELLPSAPVCFDIGANHGEITATLLGLGARLVVAAEPQLELATFIENNFTEAIVSKRLVVIPKAIGDQTGVAKFYPAQDINKCMSTLSSIFVEVSQHNGDRWDSPVDVDVITVDSLIKDFGIPDYIKIDVEGFDYNVLMGLSTAVSLLSFEYNTQMHLIDIAVDCIKRIASLGTYCFNYQTEAPNEIALQLSTWVDAETMIYMLKYDIGRKKVHGDIFAKRVI